MFLFYCFYLFMVAKLGSGHPESALVPPPWLDFPGSHHICMHGSVCSGFVVHSQNDVQNTSETTDSIRGTVRYNCLRDRQIQLLLPEPTMLIEERGLEGQSSVVPRLRLKGPL